jgi:hypothetical protein
MHQAVRAGLLGLLGILHRVNKFGLVFDLLFFPYYVVSLRMCLVGEPGRTEPFHSRFLEWNGSISCLVAGTEPF